jgi:hypothetical protein
MNFFTQLKKNIADFFFLTDKNVLLFTSHMSQIVQNLKDQKASLLIILIPNIIFLILIYVLTNTINSMQLELSQLIDNVNSLNKTVAILAESQKIQQPAVAKIVSSLSNASTQQIPYRARAETMIDTTLMILMVLAMVGILLGCSIPPRPPRARNCGVDDIDSNLTMDELNFFFSDTLDEEFETSIFDKDMSSDIIDYLVELSQTGAFTL